MKICLDIRSLLIPKTGVGHYTYNLTKALLSMDQLNEYHLFYFNFKRTQHDFSLNGNNVFRQEITAVPGRMANLIWKYSNIMKLDNFIKGMDVFHFPNFTVPPLKQGKVILNIHDLSFIRYPQYTEPKNLKYLKKVFLRSLHRADLILTGSEFVKQELLDTYNLHKDKICVIYNGLDPAFLKKQDPQDVLRVKNKYQLPDKYIINVGTLEPRKNIPGLIKAYKMYKARQKGQIAKLVITGIKGWLYQQIFAEVKQLHLEKEVIFTGYVEDGDLPVLYQASQLLVYPSFYEGFGFPVIEAMASRIPVICSDISSLPEVGGNAALYCKPADLEDISDKIEQVLANESLRQTMIAKGEEQVKKFSWENAAGQVLTVYQKFN